MRSSSRKQTTTLPVLCIKDVANSIAAAVGGGRFLCSNVHERWEEEPWGHQKPEVCHNESARAMVQINPAVLELNQSHCSHDRLAYKGVPGNRV